MVQNPFSSPANQNQRPLSGRLAENIMHFARVLREAGLIEQTSGAFEGQDQIFQELHRLPVVAGETPSPLQRVAGSADAVVTQYASSTKANAVEKIGLLKMDFLGLKNLTIIENTLKIAKKVGKEVPDIEKLELNDEAAYKVLQDAHTTGVFQLESTGMKRWKS
mgnify:CR=1 FL=1